MGGINSIFCQHANGVGFHFLRIFKYSLFRCSYHKESVCKQMHFMFTTIRLLIVYEYENYCKNIRLSSIPKLQVFPICHLLHNICPVPPGDSTNNINGKHHSRGKLVAISKFEFCSICFI